MADNGSSSSRPMAGLEMLPNELLLQIISEIPTRELLRLTVVSRRFFAAVLRVIHYRLTVSVAEGDEYVLLECYHPSVQYTAPQLPCFYIGKHGLESDFLSTSVSSDLESLKKLTQVYSAFRPITPEVSRSASRNSVPDRDFGRDRLATQTVFFDTHELFTQLCTVTHLVRDEPQRGLFTSFLTMGEGVIRVFRNWVEGKIRKGSAENDEDEDVMALGPMDTDVLWVDTTQNQGMKLRVREARPSQAQQPLLVLQDEETSHHFELGFEALFVRSIFLLIKVEASMQQDADMSGRAVVFGQFR